MSAVMTEMPEAANAKNSEIEALSSAFGSFVRVTEELRASYEKLRERADRIDVELARANEQLRQKVDELDRLTGHLNGVLTAIPSGVVVSDASGIVIDLNGAAQRILGLTREQAIGKQRENVRDAQGEPMLLEANDNEAATGRERVRVLLDGSVRVLGGAISAIRDGQGRQNGNVEVVEDLTEISTLRERIHRNDKLAALGEMSAVIAHEIRNPLNGVQGFADLLGRKLSGTDETLADYAKKIVRGVREVDAIIADLLAFAAPERFQPSAVDLEPVVRRAAQAIAQARPGEDIQIAIEFPHAGLRIAGDTVKLGQIFRNLISNAVEACEGRPQIRIHASTTGARVSVSIEDNGRGVAENDRAKIFDPFFTTKTQGTGLGLAIVRKLVELHAGTIDLAAPASGHGARFELSFPTFRIEDSKHGN